MNDEQALRWVSSVSLHVGIMNLEGKIEQHCLVSSVSLHVGIMNWGNPGIGRWGRFQRVSARRNYELNWYPVHLIRQVSSVSLHVGIMNSVPIKQRETIVSSVSLHVGIMN